MRKDISYLRGVNNYMMNSKTLSKFAFATLVSIYIVIIAGSIVRSTGSGMGCPDWPKCFGYYIPPTEVEQVLWKPNKSFQKGQFIVYNEALWSAKQDIISEQSWKPEAWEKYTKHDYAEFNVAHTWTEYLNRLSGAVSGFMCLLLLIFSFKYTKRKDLRLLSVLVLLGMVFQAWLGATVVFSVLAPHKITIHMLMALVLVAWMIIYIERLKDDNISILKVSKSMKTLIYTFFALGIVQILLGTQVRQEVDVVAKAMGEFQRPNFLNALSSRLIVHIGVAYAMLFIGLILIRNTRRNYKTVGKLITYSFICIIIGYLVGIIFRYAGFPAWAQPVHLLISTLLFGFQFMLVFRVSKNKNILKF
ncbi:MAG: COX15/CtaA family protein [Flavobacteriales bacterium]